MDDLLSDGEVSALLSELDAGMTGPEGAEAASGSNAPETGVTLDERGRKIKTYDFNRPNRFSKDHMRTLEMLHEIFSRGFTAAVAAYLRTVAEIKVVSVTQLPFREYTMSLPRPDCIFVLKMEPLEGSFLMEINPELVLTLIDRILGGPGKAPNAARELTLIEQSVIEKIVNRGMENLQEAWLKVGHFQPKLTGYETTAQFVQIVAPNEIAAVIEFEVKINEITGKMSMCIPYVVLEPVIGDLSAQKWFTVGKKESTVETVENLTKVMKGTSVPIVAQVGKTQINVRELLNLKAGDVIRLNTSPHAEIEILIEGLIKLSGRPGVSSKKKAIQITRVHSRENNT
ncbi:MAG TPA: flagellar motor switch protein FliM [bacterium]|nr:flagellar motor switch protein FliM [bacterium]